MTEWTTDSITIVSPQETKRQAFYLACGDGSISSSNKKHVKDKHKPISFKKKHKRMIYECQKPKSETLNAGPFKRPHLLTVLLFHNTAIHHGRDCLKEIKALTINPISSHESSYRVARWQADNMWPTHYKGLFNMPSKSN